MEPVHVVNRDDRVRPTDRPEKDFPVGCLARRFFSWPIRTNVRARGARGGPELLVAEECPHDAPPSARSPCRDNRHGPRKVARANQKKKNPEGRTGIYPVDLDWDLPESLIFVRTKYPKGLPKALSLPFSALSRISGRPVYDVASRFGASAQTEA